MTFETAEPASKAASLIRLYDFAMGVIHYRFTSGDRADDYLASVWEVQPISDDGQRLTGETSGR